VIGDPLRSGLHAVTERDGVIGREIVESEHLNRGTLGFYVRRSCVDWRSIEIEKRRRESWIGHGGHYASAVPVIARMDWGYGMWRWSITAHLSRPDPYGVKQQFVHMY